MMRLTSGKQYRRPPGGLAINAEIEAFRIAFNQHLVCNHILVQHLVPGMKRKGYGRIINVISTSVKQPLNNLGVSNTIRGAVANWSKTLANELGEFGITVNNVLPGATDTSRLNGIISKKSEATGKSYDEVKQGMANQVPLQTCCTARRSCKCHCFFGISGRRLHLRSEPSC